MEIIFNDGKELAIQDHIEQDGQLEIRTISATELEIVTLFASEFATRVLKVEERGQIIATYERYTQLDAIIKYTAGIIGVRLTQTGKSQGERLEELEETAEKQEKSMEDAIRDMQMAIAELTILMAQVLGGPMSPAAGDGEEEDGVEASGEDVGMEDTEEETVAEGGEANA